MIGIDTNVLLRLFLQDDEDQTLRAMVFVPSPFAINPIVLCEFARVLGGKRYKQSRRQIADYLESLLIADDVEVAFADSARRALSAYRNGRAEFSDYYIACINTDLGSSSTITFDKAALEFHEFSAVPTI